ncbi:MAG: VWA domain-containing protein [Chloroflexota bacterium]|nr:MAG: VWA domain-containing protein [Chloroflexota bacterium]
MTLLAPFGLVGLIALGVLVALYLLKARYRDQTVGSTYLWEQLRRDLAVHEPWQRPRFSVLLVAQAAILIGLALALARPALVAGDSAREFAVVVLDGSASMRATDVAPSRFEKARSLALERLSELPAGSTVTVILAAAAPRVVVAEETDRTVASNAVARAEATDDAGDIAAALRMAVALSRGRANPTVHLFSDNAFDAPAFDTAGIRLRHDVIAGGDDNRAIVAISARPEVANRRRYEAFARVRNYGTTPAPATIALYVDGALTDSRALTLESRADASATFVDLPLGASTIEARLLESDALASDDRAWTVLERREASHILLVTRGNVFLERVLGLLPGAESFRVPPRRAGAIDTGAYDVIVYDGLTPDILPRRPLLLINPQDGPSLPIGGFTRRPGALVADPDDPLMKFVDLREARVARLALVSAPSWARVVAEADGAPAILAGEHEGRRIVIFLFDLQNSNLPLASSFPILMANVIGYLEPSRAVDVGATHAGALVDVVPRPGTDAIRVEAESGPLWMRPIRGGLTAIEAPSRIGLYGLVQLSAGETIAIDPLAVNLTDAAESDTRPRAPDLSVAGDALAAGPPASREIVASVIIAVAALVVGEWWWFHRRA